MVKDVAPAAAHLAVMWTYHPELLAVPVPRYTSYPTAAEFTNAIGPADMHAALAAIAMDQTVSLYVHIPYCRQICWYCGCNTGAANRNAACCTIAEMSPFFAVDGAMQIGT